MQLEFLRSPELNFPEPDACLYDADGTIFRTEEKIVHELFCAAALNLLWVGATVNDMFAVYKPAFGLPGNATNMQLAEILQKQDHNKFTAILQGWQSGRSSEVNKKLSDVQKVAQRIAGARDEVMGKFFDGAITNDISHGRDKRKSLWMPDMPTGLLKNEREAAKLIKQVEIDTMPGFLALLGVARQLNIPQGICTSSGSNFIRGVLKGFGLLKNGTFAGIVTADDVRDGQHKPNPYPWQKLLKGINRSRPANRSVRMRHALCFENSLTGARSVLEAGAPLVFIPDADHRARLAQVERLIEQRSPTKVYPVSSLREIVVYLAGFK